MSVGIVLSTSWLFGHTNCEMKEEIKCTAIELWGKVFIFLFTLVAIFRRAARIVQIVRDRQLPFYFHCVEMCIEVYEAPATYLAPINPKCAKYNSRTA